VGYRNKPDLWGEPSTHPRAKGTLWSVAGIMCFNLGLLGTNVVKALGWHVSAEVLQWLSIGMGFACVAAGVVAYRTAKAQAKRDIEEMMPRNYRG
jgi:hypothetical protein